MIDETNMQALDDRLLEQMLQDFQEESREILDQLALNLTRLKENADQKDLIDKIFRLVHTLKGTAAFVGLNKISKISRTMADPAEFKRDPTISGKRQSHATGL
jgi:chemotaxis protein histidine kinase CheA